MERKLNLEIKRYVDGIHDDLRSQSNKLALNKAVELTTRQPSLADFKRAHADVELREKVVTEVINELTKSFGDWHHRLKDVGISLRFPIPDTKNKEVIVGNSEVIEDNLTEDEIKSYQEFILKSEAEQEGYGELILSVNENKEDIYRKLRTAGIYINRVVRRYNDGKKTRDLLLLRYRVEGPYSGLTPKNIDLIKKYLGKKEYFDHLPLDQLQEEIVPEFGLSVRASNALKRGSVTRIEEVISAYSYNEMPIEFRNFGAQSVDELVDYLAIKGIIPITSD